MVQARAIVMPLNVRLSPLELINILNHSGARMLLFENDFVPLVEKLKPACREIERFVTINDKVPDRGPDLRGTARQGPRRARGHLQLRRKRRRRAVLYQRKHGNAQRRDAGPPHAVPARTGGGQPVSKNRRDDGGSAHHPAVSCQRLGTSAGFDHAGLKQIMVRRFEPTGVFKLIQEHHATDMSLVPTMANALLNAPDLGQLQLVEHAQYHAGRRGVVA